MNLRDLSAYQCLGLVEFIAETKDLSPEWLIQRIREKAAVVKARYQSEALGTIGVAS